MTLCWECGANVAPGESFCGHCGARQQHDDTPVVSDSGSVAADSRGVSTEVEAVTVDQKLPIPTDSEKLAEKGSTTLDGEPGHAPASGTGELVESSEFLPMTSRPDDVRGKRQKPKALPGGKILNHRYEIVRRIGGGGMGA